MRKVPSFRCLSACFLTLLTSSLYGQSGFGDDIKELIKSPIPPSPNAAALGKFGEIPVGLSTGIPSISVPIYAWQDKMKELSLNVGLSYHPGGHKVADMASNCGLGWALNAGGVISRTVRGLPDDGIGGYLNTPALPSYLTQPVTDFILDENVGTPVGLTLNNSLDFYTARNITEGTLDGEFDIFNISVGDIAAKFFIDKNGTVTFINQTNIVLSYEREPNSSGQYIKKFTIIDERGLTYILDVLEASSTSSVEQVPGRQSTWNISSYYVSKILSADKKDSIQFTYQTGNELSYYGGFSDFWRVTKRGDVLQSIDYTQSYSIYQNAPLRISQIALPDNTMVSFSYAFAREDYYGDYALTDVTITNDLTSRKYKLYYDYFVSDCISPGCIPIGYTLNNELKRLKLTKVQQISGIDSIPPYLFEYNPAALPIRNSRQVDHWGYYALAFTAGSGWDLPTWPPVQQDPALQLAPEIEPVEESTKAAVLEKIIYPTGGYTKFTYHINDAFSTDYHLGGAINTMELHDNIAGSFVSLPFNNRNNDSVFFSVQLHNNLPLPENEPIDESCPITITVQSTDNTVSQTINGNYSNTADTWLALSAGKTYLIKFNTQCGWISDYYFTVRYQYGIVPKNRNVGGLRIEKAEDADGLGNLITTKYEYQATDSKSSGQLNVLPVYTYYRTTTNHPYYEGVGPYIDLHWNRVSSPNQTMSYFKGSPVIYTRAKVNKSSLATNIGYSVHEFSFQPVSYIQDSYYPFLQKPEADWVQGLPLRDSLFSGNNELVKTVIKEYDGTTAFNDSAKARNLIAGLLFSDAMGTLSSYVYGAKSYYVPSGQLQIKKSTEIVYNGGTNLKTVTEYSYDPNNYLLTKEKTSNSKGDTIETRLYYPFNYSIATDNRSGSVISKERWKKINNIWYMAGAMVNDFAQFNSTFIKQRKVIASESTTPLAQSVVGAFDPASLARHNSFKDQAEFMKYDARGRYLELKSTNGTVTSYMWSGVGNIPMAQVVNTTSDKIAYTSFEADGKGNWSFAGAAASDASSPTGNQCYNMTGGNITSATLPSGAYIVSYWGKTGSVTVNGVGPVKTGMTIGSWTYYEHTVSGTSVTVSGNKYIDELRLYPVIAQMTTYTNAPLVGLTSQCDVNNRITYYEYDGFGRLKTIRDQDKNVIKTLDYQYLKNYNQ